MSLPLASLIIGSRDRPDLLADTVASVLQGEEVPAEMVIVDQSRSVHPTIGKLEASRGCQVRYLWVETTGLSRGRNTAIAAARYDILAVIDDDMYVAPDWFSSLVQALEHGGPRSVVSGQVQPYFPEGGLGFVPSTKIAESPAVYQGRVEKDVLLTGNMSMYRAAVEAVGVFDERLGPGTKFPSAEDSDFGFRLLEAGFCIRYVPEAVVYHRAWRSEGDYLPLRWSYGLGRGAFYAKYFDWRDRYMQQRMLADIRNHLLAFPFHLRRERLRAYGDLTLAWGILVGAARWLATERKKSGVGSHNAG
jgi:GT2 family glycosyltransferase